MTDDDTITRDELAEALRQLKLGHEDENTFYPAVADAIFAKAERNREPEYKPGAMYQDFAGEAWKFGRLRGPDEPCWHKPGADRPYAFDAPMRPLARLVLEGSPLADSERDLIHADLGKLLDLLGMGDFARPQSSHEVFLMCLEEVAKLLGDRKETCPGGC